MRLEQSAEWTRQPDAGPPPTRAKRKRAFPFVWQLAGDPIRVGPARGGPVPIRRMGEACGWRAPAHSTHTDHHREPLRRKRHFANRRRGLERIRGVEPIAEACRGGAGDTIGVAPLGLRPLGEGFIAAFSGSSEAAIAANGLEGRLRFESTARHSLWAPHGVADLGERVWCVSSPSSAQIGVLRERIIGNDSVGSKRR